MAVFYRTNAQTRALEEVFIRHAIPYRVIGGTKFYERAEIKDIMAYLTVIANPADTLAMRRILNTPKRGIGQATETALAGLADSLGVPLSEALKDSGSLGLGPKVQKAIEELDSLLVELRSRIDTASPADIMKEVVSRTRYQEILLSTRNPQDDARSENVDELVAVASEFSRDNPEATLIDFLTEVSLVAAADELDDSQGSVSLMTLHTAKGLEFDAVFLTGCEEQLLPHRMSANEPGGLAEERRLFYVGMTRARKYLALSLAMSRMIFGDVQVSSPSRFLSDIPDRLISWRETPGLQQVTSGGGRSRFVDREPMGLPRAPRKKTEWANRVDSVARDNSAMEVAVGDRLRHTDFGEGTVTSVSGEGAKRVAEVVFDHAGKKRLLVKIAPIEKIG
jgi:DNA helicase-2/ATP-dependent DNA helicase PcrA